VLVLIGVGLTSLALLHLAEQLAGRGPFRRWALGANGKPELVPVGGCSNGFDTFEPIVAPAKRHTLVRAQPVELLRGRRGGYGCRGGDPRQSAADAVWRCRLRVGMASPAARSSRSVAQRSP
jgi:hypothetical protein